MSKRSCWEIYNKQMSQLNRGDALWEPAPLSNYKRIQLGDVGYISRGCFHLLFSAGCPLGERRLGVDVPLTFNQLEVGPTFRTQPRLPGHLSTDSVRETRVRLPPSTSPVPTLEPGSSISFQLTENQGAVLVTKYLTHREDIQLAGNFEKYVKDHYDSWVTFARDSGHGNDIRPVLVTGVDMTRDFAMMAYSTNDANLTSEFTTSAAGVGSVWGTWRATGSVHTNCGPHLCYSPSPTQTTDPMSSGNTDTEAVSGEDNQCVFVRYYTVRKRLGIPRVIKAAAGPRDLGSGGRDNGESLPEIQWDSDPGSDFASSLFDGVDDDSSSATSIDSESDIVTHNTTSDERDDFDAIADYVFQNSDADSVLIHHQDITLLREPGSNTELSTQLIEKRPPITVNGDGVGTIGAKTDSPANLSFNGPLDITLPSWIPATSRVTSLEPRPPSLPEHPLPTLLGRVWEVATGTIGSIFEWLSLAGRFPLFSSGAALHNPSFYDRESPRFSDSDGTHQPLPAPMELEVMPFGVFSSMALQTAVSLPSNWFRIPQMPYNQGRKSWDFKPLEPISFSVNGRPGVNMGDALHRRFTGLDGRDDLILQDAGDVISCRLSFPGYPRNSSFQIPARSRNAKRDPITRSKLAYEIARKLKQHLASMSSRPINRSTLKQWRTGEEFMHLDNMFLVRLDSVSRGSFQPEIWVADPNPPQIPESRPTTTRRLGSPPQSTISSLDPTSTASTTLGVSEFSGTSLLNLSSGYQNQSDGLFFVPRRLRGEWLRDGYVTDGTWPSRFTEASDDQLAGESGMGLDAMTIYNERIEADVPAFSPTFPSISGYM